MDLQSSVGLLNPTQPEDGWTCIGVTSHILMCTTQTYNSRVMWLRHIKTGANEGSLHGTS